MSDTHISKIAAAWPKETAYERAWKCRVYLLMCGVLSQVDNHRIGMRIEELSVKKYRRKGRRFRKPQDTKQGG